ncbi:MAG: TolC family protein [Prevotella sp.]|nr:TolC family protein [Prevotella sp.]
MEKLIGLLLLFGTTVSAGAQELRNSDSMSGQRLLTLDSCRAMALRNNKQMAVQKVKQDVAHNLRKAAFTKYLPHFSAIGSYTHTSRPVSLLNDQQKQALPQLGTATAAGLQQTTGAVGQSMERIGGVLAQMGIPMGDFQQMAGQMQQQMGEGMQKIATDLNGMGQGIVDAFNTDTRNIWAGSVLFTQPVFMGGSIIALNRIAKINEDLVENSADARLQSTLYATEQAYWQVVSLRHKQKLAEAYLGLVKKLDEDVHKMIDEGVATRSDGLSVDVKVNEAEMTLKKVNDGLVLSKMLLCQTIGIPINEQITLADENAEQIAVVKLTPQLEVERAVGNRPELKILQNSVDMSKQATNILKAGNLPQMMLTGGYAVSNPNVFNGFEKKFAGFWNVGVLVRIPIWNWGDTMYKVRASKGATAIANLELEEAREMIELQVNQVTYKVDEANKRLVMAQSNIQRADENLRTANVGFKEGVITPTTVMEAQTAWLQAQSQKIDAEIDVKLSQVELQKSLGVLSER